MAKIHLLRKDRVLSCGGNDYRVILDQDAKIAYQYNNPENVTAVYSENLKAWVTHETPHYSPGGWGSGSSGDSVGYHTMQNTLQILNALKVKYFYQTSMNFLNNKELIQYNKTIKQYNDKIARLNQTILKVEGKDSYSTLSKKYEIELKSRNGNCGMGLGKDVFKIIDQYDSITQLFLSDKIRKDITVDDYVFSRRKLVQKPNNNWDKKDTVVAFYNDKNLLVMNSQLLKISDFEKEFLGSESVVQKLIRDHAKIAIPFNVLEAAELKLEDTKIIEQGQAEDFKIDGKTRHFTGALLLENSGKKFLMDVDRNEIRHGIFNAFFVEVKPEVETIEQAYESMKPQEVKDAEAQGIEVLRQGEWFFIPTDITAEMSSERIKTWKPRAYEEQEERDKGYMLRSEIRHGKGRPNTLYTVETNNPKYKDLVTGIVSHTGREHKDLVLCKDTAKIIKDGRQYDSEKRQYIDKPFVAKMWRVLGNTTVSNFQITGDID